MPRNRGMGSQRFEHLQEVADKLYVKGRSSNALQKIDQALRIEPRNAEALVIKGRILVSLLRVNEALKSYDEAISIDPPYSQAYLERARILYSGFAGNTRALREAKKAFQLAGRDRWDRFEALRIQAIILQAMDRNTEVIPCCYAALRIKSKDPEIKLLLGSSLLFIDQARKALRHLDQARRLLSRQKKLDQVNLGLAIEFQAEALQNLTRHRQALKTVEFGLNRLTETVSRERLIALRKELSEKERIDKGYIISLRDFRKLRAAANKCQKRDQSEVCGLLIGNDRGALELRFLTNRSSRPGSFEIDRKDYLKLRKIIRSQGKHVHGTFHSHPISEAIPSKGDVRQALMGLSLIYDVCGREARLWRIFKKSGRKVAKEVPFELKHPAKHGRRFRKAS